MREKYGLDRILLDEDSWDKFDFQTKLTEMQISTEMKLQKLALQISSLFSWMFELF